MMGWISKRFNQNPAKWGTPISEKKRKAPLRKIMWIVRGRQNMFDSDLVHLECGHQVYAYGAARARCTKCQPNHPL